MDAHEFNQIVDLYSDALYRFCLKNASDPDMANDLVQDAFEKLWKNRNSVDPAKVKSYLFTVAYHKFVDEYRRKQKNVSWDDKTAEPSHTRQYSDLKEILDKAIDRLPAIQKNVLLLRDWEGYSYKEIGEITGLSESQVKVYIFRARKFLRQVIGSIETVL